MAQPKAPSGPQETTRSQGTANPENRKCGIGFSKSREGGVDPVTEGGPGAVAGQEEPMSWAEERLPGALVGWKRGAGKGVLEAICGPGEKGALLEYLREYGPREAPKEEGRTNCGCWRRVRDSNRGLVLALGLTLGLGLGLAH